MTERVADHLQQHGPPVRGAQQATQQRSDLRGEGHGLVADALNLLLLHALLHLFDHGRQVVAERHLTKVDRNRGPLRRETDGGTIGAVDVLERNALKDAVLGEEDGVGVLDPAAPDNVTRAVTRAVVFTCRRGVLVRGVART